ncbi:glutamate--tRNA ligase family protein [Mucilaginibacter sp. RS28]|uniref:Glutamate--tRNA ligase family protein n=1 Tax=Mucilaginibacter straminoryzae TaxID=2932774 RepID=A0A9X2BAU1_9SPHI|nr:glutamate--tRNA ligase family protein [Mucilaginibacter straminoryzae]MCJ8211771.1 glutamate--tRNA ligase family protein [Mucilaginibacter straminoryzae]
MASETTFTRTRIAPTPSGFLHVGNVLSFAVTAALAEQYGAKILLRIDDLDQARVNPAFVQDIFDTLNFLEIPWHEGPKGYADYQENWSQLHRMEHYKKLLEQLRQQQLVFACTCSRADIKRFSNDETYPGTCLIQHKDLNTPESSWRLKTVKDATVAVKGLKAITTERLPASMQNFVVRKKDSFPAYQLSSLADDIFFGVDLIVRGQDLRDSTLAQLHLAQSLGLQSFLDTAFYHHPLIKGNNGLKLSKSAGDTSIQALRKQGKTPADIFSMIAGMLGHDEGIKNWRELGQLLLSYPIENLLAIERSNQRKPGR